MFSQENNSNKIKLTLFFFPESVQNIWWQKFVSEILNTIFDFLKLKIREHFFE